MSFRYDVEVYADSIIAQIDKFHQLCNNSKRTSNLQEYKVLNGQEEEDLQEKSQTNRAKSFRDIIQYKDKNKLLERLHELIDGKSGAEVGAVLLNAWYINPYLTRRPTRAEFESEFELIGSWSAISNYLSDNNQNAIDLAIKIVIF